MSTLSTERLSRLPRELRDMIWSEVAQSGPAVVPSDIDTPTSCWTPLTAVKSTCRIFRAEATDLESKRRTQMMSRVLFLEPGVNGLLDTVSAATASQARFLAKTQDTTAIILPGAGRPGPGFVSRSVKELLKHILGRHDQWPGLTHVFVDEDLARSTGGPLFPISDLVDLSATVVDSSGPSSHPALYLAAKTLDFRRGDTSDTWEYISVRDWTLPQVLQRVQRHCMPYLATAPQPTRSYCGKLVAKEGDVMYAHAWREPIYQAIREVWPDHIEVVTGTQRSVEGREVYRLIHRGGQPGSERSID